MPWRQSTCRRARLAPGQDIPLQLEIADDNGLPAKMELFYNRSGRGWESMIPHANRCDIRRNDLPLIDESSVPLPSEETGWLDVYISGTIWQVTL